MPPRQHVARGHGDLGKELAVTVTHDLVGIDPGIVHTGVVVMSFRTTSKTIAIDHVATAGTPASWVKQWLGMYSDLDHIFIEAYRPRSHFDQDSRMGDAVRDLKAVLPRATVLDNTGVLRVVKRPLMEALGVWNFSTPTHHQDLRSAARIALLGAFKDETLNGVIADVIRDHINNNPWRIVTL